MTNINFKVVGLTRPGFENARSRFEPETVRSLDLQKREADALFHSATMTGLPEFGEHSRSMNKHKPEERRKMKRGERQRGRMKRGEAEKEEIFPRKVNIMKNNSTCSKYKDLSSEK